MWVACATISMSDHTLNVLLDHLRDLDLPTILARMADRSEPYYGINLCSVASFALCACIKLNLIKSVKNRTGSVCTSH